MLGRYESKPLNIVLKNSLKKSSQNTCQIKAILAKGYIKNTNIILFGWNSTYL